MYQAFYLEVNVNPKGMKGTTENLNVRILYNLRDNIFSNVYMNFYFFSKKGGNTNQGMFNFRH